MRPLIELIIIVIDLYKWVVIAQVIMSWLVSFVGQNKPLMASARCHVSNIFSVNASAFVVNPTASADLRIRSCWETTLATICLLVV